MEIEQVQAHEATISSGPAAEKQTVVSDRDARPDTSASSTPQVENTRLTPESLVERAKKHKKTTEKASKTEEKAKVEAAPKVENTDENEAKTAPKSEEFTPRTKFVANHKEYDIPEWARGLIKNKETEDKFVEVYEKALGLDHVKQRHQELNDKYKKTSTDLSTLNNGINELRNIYNDALNTGNLLRLDDFFEKLQIPSHVVLQYALSRAQYEQLPPEQRNAVDGYLQTQRRAQTFEQQNQELTNNAFQAEVRARTMALDSALTRPEIASIVSAFDSAQGRNPGDFKELVRQHGEYVWYKSQGKTDLDPETAIKEVIEKFRLTAAPVTQSAAPQITPSQTPPVATPATVAPHRNVPTIPVVGGKPSSPMRARPKSIDDIKRISREKFAG